MVWYNGGGLLFSYFRLQIGVDEIVDVSIENGVSVGFFVFGASVLDEFVGLEDIIADLLAPFGAFAGAEFGN